MILPPILSNNGVLVKEAIENYLGIQCVKKVTIEEQFTHVTFLSVPITDKIKQFIHDLSNVVTISYGSQTYKITSEYLG